MKTKYKKIIGCLYVLVSLCITSFIAFTGIGETPLREVLLPFIIGLLAWLGGGCWLLGWITSRGDSLSQLERLCEDIEYHIEFVGLNAGTRIPYEEWHLKEIDFAIRYYNELNELMQKKGSYLTNLDDREQKRLTAIIEKVGSIKEKMRDVYAYKEKAERIIKFRHGKQTRVTDLEDSINDEEFNYASLEKDFESKWKQSPWWGALPTTSPLMVDTCVWMDDAQEIEIWFEWLKQNVREGRVCIHILSNVYEEIINNAKSHDSKKAFLARTAKKRVFELQQISIDVESFRILNLTAEGIKEKEDLYADPQIIKFLLANPSYTLYTRDLDLQIRVTQMAKEKGVSVRVEGKDSMLLASAQQLRSAFRLYSTD